MKAWIIEGFVGIEKARLIEVSDPVPAAGEVVLRVHFAALNPADRYLAQGEYPAKPPMPHILGRDGSGVIAATGSGRAGSFHWPEARHSPRRHGRFAMGERLPNSSPCRRNRD
jgi:NADPH:quinone reductase-like Zn-dependent oxidoreductase